MTDQEEQIIPGKLFFDNNNQERKSLACLGQTCSRSLFVFLSHLLVVCRLTLVAFGEFSFQKVVTDALFGWEFCAVQQDTFYPHQD